MVFVLVVVVIEVDDDDDDYYYHPELTTHPFAHHWHTSKRVTKSNQEVNWLLLLLAMQLQ